MAGYKVPQDVEADDKFLGPLSFKQFIFMCIGGVCAYLIFFFITRGIWPIAVVLFIPLIIAGFLAFPWSKDQPTELWLASRIRFMIKPRKQVWDQSGIKHLVNVTAPNTPVHRYTDGLAPEQVQDRLSALAAMADSRGWAVKNTNPFAPGAPAAQTMPHSDRLVAAAEPVVDQEEQKIKDTPDVLDENTGVIAKQFDNLIGRSEEKHRQKTQELVDQARQAIQQPDTPADPAKDENFWFKNQQRSGNDSPIDPSGSPSLAKKGLATFQSSTVVAPSDPATQTTDDNDSSSQAQSTDDDQAVLAQFKEKQRIDRLQAGSSHIKRIPTSEERFVLEAEKAREDAQHAAEAAAAEQATRAQKATEAQAAKPEVTPPTNPVILDLARNNDQNIATLGRRANRQDRLPPDEVVVPLR